MRKLAFIALLLSGCRVDPNNLPPMTFAVPVAKVWPVTPYTAPPGPGEGRIYTTDNLDDTMSIVDLDSANAGTPKLLAKVPVGFVPVEREGPHHVTADAKGEFYYFGISNFVPGSGSGPHGQHGAGTIDGHMVKMSVADNSFVADVRVEPNPGDVRLTPDGKTLITTHFDLVKIQKGITANTLSGATVDSDMAIIDPVTMQREAFVELCPASHGVAITADSSTAITSCFDDEVAFVDLKGADHTVTKVPVLANPGTIAAPACEPYSVTLDGDTAWVSCFSFNAFGEGTGPVIGVDVPTKSLNGRFINLASSSTAAFGDVRNGVFVVAHQNEDGITFFDVTQPTPTLIQPDVLLDPAQCQKPHVARFNEDGTKVFAVCEGDHSHPGSFVVIDATTHLVVGSVDLGIYPDDIAIMRRPQ